MPYAEMVRTVLFALALAGVGWAQNFHAYIGQIESRSVLIAWGTTKGPNTIGRYSVSLGKATITLGGTKVETERNWALFEGLQPDTAYPYQLSVKQEKAQGVVRTYPERTGALRFFVIGDYGNGTPQQKEIARAMLAEYRQVAHSTNPPRFVLTTGDNIYADYNLGIHAIHSGDDDADWEPKFFTPYAEILREIPFYPSPGNHDGNGNENRGDLRVYLDNFFYPRNQPARWYSFQVGGIAEFFSLDSTTNSDGWRPRPAYLANGEQYAWLRKALAGSQAPWKIPYFHHPPFNAGPYHGASYGELKHFCESFAAAGVKVVFTGHEHNFQFSERNGATGGIRYVITGAGGELRPGDVRAKMAGAHIAGWAAERHFLDVEIDGSTIRISPVADKPVMVVDRDGRAVAMPLVVSR
jgi:hypothetical protein